MSTPLVELVLKHGGQEIGRHRLEAGEYVLGREPGCQIVLDDTDISRRHLRLTISEQGAWAEDLGSSNGTYLGMEEMASITALNLPATLRIGTTMIEVSSMPLAQPTQRFPWAKNVQALFDMGALSQRKYEQVQRIVRGGTGMIEEVRDLNLRRPVAMKVLLPERHESLEELLRFVQAAQLAGQLEHPNIVPVHELGVNDIGQVYTTMKLVKGQRLSEILLRIAANDLHFIAQYPLHRLLEIFQKVCDALAYAHSQGVIHRDLKPENIMIGEFGEVLVADWGLAKVLRPEPGEEVPWQKPEPGLPPLLNPSAAVQTMDGMIMGTPEFMSPEQAEGRVHDVDERTDIFALGGLLYHIITLQPPVTGASLPEMLAKVRSGDIPHPSSLNNPLPHCPNGRIPAGLSEIAMKAMAFQKEDRYVTVRELHDALESCVASRPHTSGFRVSPLLLGVGALACILVGAALALIILKIAG
jgi:eukaryotic-like serine/threonine-protein kinase